MAKKLSFSVNLHDQDGDVYDDCILLHIDEGVILKFGNLAEYDQFIEDMQGMRAEIVESTDQ